MARDDAYSHALSGEEDEYFKKEGGILYLDDRVEAWLMNRREGPSERGDRLGFASFGLFLILIGLAILIRSLITLSFQVMRRVH